MRRHLDNILPVIVATVVLHNVAQLTRDEDPDDDEALEHFNNRRQRGIQVDYAPVDALPPTGPVPAGATGIRRAVIDSFNR